MKNKYLLVLFSILISLSISSCRTIKEIEIETIKPSAYTFPKEVNNIAIVHSIKDPIKLEYMGLDKSKEAMFDIKKTIAFSNGNPQITIHQLTNKLANEYQRFNSIVISGEVDNTSEKMNELAKQLNVDAILVLDKLNINILREYYSNREISSYQSITCAKINPELKIYLQQRKKAILKLNIADSIYWDAYGESQQELLANTIPDSIATLSASEYAGLMIAQKIMPHWTSESRYIFSDFTSGMKNAVTLVEEGYWEKAYTIWNNIYNHSRNKTRRMRAAYNIANYFEISDKIDDAMKWANVAKEMSLGKKESADYNFIMKYIQTLTQRKSDFIKLELQMQKND